MDSFPSSCKSGHSLWLFVFIFLSFNVVISLFVHSKNFISFRTLLFLEGEYLLPLHMFTDELNSFFLDCVSNISSESEADYLFKSVLFFLFLAICLRASSCEHGLFLFHFLGTYLMERKEGPWYSIFKFFFL
jgi:hypothetical protein